MSNWWPAKTKQLDNPRC